jgi:hypothetical protein
MFGCNSNFIETNDFAMAIVTERDAIIFTIILLEEYEHHSLIRHMIYASTIKHLTCTPRGESNNNQVF